MKRRIIKIAIIVTAVIILLIAGVLLYLNFFRGSIKGKIEFGETYYLSEIRDTELFAGAAMDKTSYFKINEDKQTGTLHLVGWAADTVDFIVTKYQEGHDGTKINIEFIYQNKLQKLSATSTNSGIYFTSVEPHGVKVIQENADANLKTLKYEVPILVFRKGVA